jgi:hypothetical protein
MLKYLRIAVTALSLAACVVMIALWVRSYTWTDAIRWRVSETGNLLLNSAPGKLSLSWFRGKLWNGAWTTRSSQELAREQEEIPQFFARIGQTMQPPSSFAFRWSDQHFHVRSPHWCTYLVRLLRRSCRDTLDQMAILPPHTANRHDAGGAVTWVDRASLTLRSAA